MCKPSDDQLRECLAALDERLAEGRIERLRFLVNEFGPPRHLMIYGGMVPTQALEEMRIAYLNGQFIACTVLAQIVMEHLFSGLFNLAGRNDHERMGFAALSTLARDEDVISQQEFEAFEDLRTRRNPYSHHKPMLAEGTLERRAGELGVAPDILLEEDASVALRTVFHILRRYPFTFAEEDPDGST